MSQKITIGVIATGGTLAMEEKGGILVPAKDLKYLLSRVNLRGLEGKVELPSDLQVDLMNIDSVNMNPRHWEKIINKVEALQEQCDGILILHGTDTMAYSASALALSLVLRGKIPVVFTGAQLPLVEMGTDAAGNLERALQVLRQAAFDGSIEPMIFFGDEAYRGVTTSKASESRLKAFDSASIAPVYTFDAFGVSRSTQPRMKHHQQQAIHTFKSITGSGFDLETHFSVEVQLVALNPGITGSTIEYYANNPDCRLLILRSFGAGNVPTIEEEEYLRYNLIPAIRSITKKGKIVIITSPFRGGNTNMQVYEGGSKAAEAGAIDAGRMTDEAALVKAQLLLGQPHFSLEEMAKDPDGRRTQFEKLFKVDLAGETGRIFEYVATTPLHA